MKGETLNELALFAGAGGGILGGKLLGWNTIGAVEIEKYPREVLLQRQRDGILKPFPIWDDITTFDGRPWKGCVDIVSGGFPCQDISAAGKGAGITGERSGLWGEFKRVVYEIRPDLVYVENSPMLTSRGLGVVLRDLAEMGYNARWCVLGADDAGARHRRKRIWILGYSIEKGLERQPRNESDGNQSRWIRKEKTGSISEATLCRNKTDLAYSKSIGRNVKKTDDSSKMFKQGFWSQQPGRQNGSENDRTENRFKRPLHESYFTSVADGMAHRVDRLKAIGNGQVPAVAATAFTVLSEGLI